MSAAEPSALHVIRSPLSEAVAAQQTVRIPVERYTLAKRRWRGVAEDGREFGFDLERPLADGTCVFVAEGTAYVIAQKYEPVLEVGLANEAAVAAKLGWMIGNLHFPLEVLPGHVRVVDDPALRQLFEREGIAYASCKRVFHPLSGGHTH